MRCDHLLLVEAGMAARKGQVQGLAVVAQRELALAEVLETDREVERVVGIGRLQLEGLEVGLLRRRPLALCPRRDCRA